MDTAESIAEIEKEIEVEPELKETTISAKLVFTKEQV